MTALRCSCASGCAAAVASRIRRANVYTVRDGKIAEIRIFEHDQYELDAYLGD